MSVDGHNHEEHHHEQHAHGGHHHAHGDAVADAVVELQRAEAEVEQAVAALASAEEGVKKAQENLEKAEHERRNRVFVSVCTTAGFWPVDGFMPVPVDQAIQAVLDETKRELEIPDASGWVARVGDRVVNVNQSYRDNGLAAGSEITVDWGPEHGGGGADA